MAKFVGRIILLMNEYMSEGYFGEMLKYPYIYRVIYLIVIKMLKVVAFMKQVAKGLQMGGGTLVLRTFIVAVSMPSLLIVGKGILRSMK